MAAVTSFINTSEPYLFLTIDPERRKGDKALFTRFKKDKDGHTRGYIVVFCASLDEGTALYNKGLAELKQKVKTNNINYDFN